MNVFSLQSEDYLRSNPIIANKDVNGLIIDILIKMRKQVISREIGEKVYRFPAFSAEDYPKNFLRCNERRYILYEKGSDGLRFFPIKQMKDDIIKNGEQSITIRYPIPKYELPLSPSEIEYFENDGWKIKMDVAVESEYNEKRTRAYFESGYDSGEELDIVCTFDLNA